MQGQIDSSRTRYCRFHPVITCEKREQGITFLSFLIDCVGIFRETWHISSLFNRGNLRQRYPPYLSTSPTWIPFRRWQGHKLTIIRNFYQRRASTVLMVWYNVRKVISLRIRRFSAESYCWVPVCSLFPANGTTSEEEITFFYILYARLYWLSERCLEYHVLRTSSWLALPTCHARCRWSGILPN